MDKMENWLTNNFELVSLAIQIFIAYHIFFLNKRLSDKAKLEHKDGIKRKTRELLSKIENEGINREVYLVNTKRYFEDYPENDYSFWRGYSHLRAEIKSTRSEGVEFFSSTPVSLYRKKDGSLSLESGKKQLDFNAYPVGVVPYEWIEYIDLEGDEGIPQFFCKFKGRGDLYWKGFKNWKSFVPWGYPYKRLSYYKESDVYHEGNDPVDNRWSQIREPVSNS
jgi:hypothetical protein